MIFCEKIVGTNKKPALFRNKWFALQHLPYPILQSTSLNIMHFPSFFVGSNNEICGIYKVYYTVTLTWIVIDDKYINNNILKEANESNHNPLRLVICSDEILCNRFYLHFADYIGIVIYEYQRWLHCELPVNLFFIWILMDECLIINVIAYFYKKKSIALVI